MTCPLGFMYVSFICSYLILFLLVLLPRPLAFCIGWVLLTSCPLRFCVKITWMTNGNTISKHQHQHDGKSETSEGCHPKLRLQDLGGHHEGWVCILRQMSVEHIWDYGSVVDLKTFTDNSISWTTDKEDHACCVCYHELWYSTRGRWSQKGCRIVSNNHTDGSEENIKVEKLIFENCFLPDHRPRMQWLEGFLRYLG